MIRARWLAALILASTPLPCLAQFGGGPGMGGGMGGMKVVGRGVGPLSVEEWTVKVEVQNGQAVTGRLKLQAVAVQCDLGLYRIKPEMIKAIEFDAKPEDPFIVGPEGSRRLGTVVTVSGETIAGVLSVPQEWEVETDLGSLQPDAQNLKAITFLERASSRQPGEKKPGNPGKPGNKPNNSGSPKTGSNSPPDPATQADPSKPD